MQGDRLCIDIMWADYFKEESLEKAKKSVFTLYPTVPFLMSLLLSAMQESLSWLWVCFCFCKYLKELGIKPIPVADSADLPRFASAVITAGLVNHSMDCMLGVIKVIVFNSREKADTIKFIASLTARCANCFFPWCSSAHSPFTGVTHLK